MIMLEFYKHKFKQIQESVLVAENNRDFKTVAKLQAKKVEFEKRIRECRKIN